MDRIDATTMRPPKPPRSPRAGASALTLTVAWHSDPLRIGEVARFEESVKVSRLEPEFARPGEAASQPLADPNVSRKPIDLVASAVGELEVTVPEGGSEVSIDGVPVTGKRVLSAQELERGACVAIAQRVVLVVRRGGGESAGLGHGLVGTSAALADAVDQLSRVAKTDASVLLRGATGTGKELAAKAIHRMSGRAERPFIAVNMTTLAATTASSQLFGHQKGAFTGASADHPGFFEAANGGTLFLDEIGETPLEVQSMLLRTLESSEIVPVGATTKRTVDVRVIAATDTDLEAAVAGERFRSPLFHRLAGYQVALPSLSARREDVGPLLAHFLGEELAKIASFALGSREPTEPLWLSTDQVMRLIMHRWPGNVRQLRNIARQLAIGCGDAKAVADAEIARHLSGGVSGPGPTSEADPPNGKAERQKPEDISEGDLIATLRANAWKTGAAASALGISRTTLYGLIERCESVRKARDIGAVELKAALASVGGDAAEAAASLEVSERGLKLRMKELGI